MVARKQTERQGHAQGLSKSKWSAVLLLMCILNHTPAWQPSPPPQRKPCSRFRQSSLRQRRTQKRRHAGSCSLRCDSRGGCMMQGSQPPAARRAATPQWHPHWHPTPQHSSRVPHLRGLDAVARVHEQRNRLLHQLVGPHKPAGNSPAKWPCWVPKARQACSSAACISACRSALPMVVRHAALWVPR